jgi:hypothetical protein
MSEVKPFYAMIDGVNWEIQQVFYRHKKNTCKSKEVQK